MYIYIFLGTTSLRVGGRAARRSCMSGLRRGGGGRQAGAAVLSCLVWRCELTARQVRSASECVRRSHCAAGRTPTQTRHRTHLSGCRADSIHTAITPDTTKQSCLSPVWRDAVNWTTASDRLNLLPAEHALITLRVRLE